MVSEFKKSEKKSQIISRVQQLSYNSGGFDKIWRVYN